jgi:hypothetical protein
VDPVGDVGGVGGVVVLHLWERVEQRVCVQAGLITPPFGKKNAWPPTYSVPVPVLSR